jgi:3-hydroxyisobutyrate dehydrogenase
MALRLLTHHQVTVFDPIRDNVLRATKAGARGASTPSDAAGDANIVLLAVRTLSHVEAALFGPEGVAERLIPGSVVILTSTVGAPGAKVIAERLGALGIQLVDAPVSGGPIRAGEGDLLMLVGASNEGLDVARSVLDQLASTVVVVGSQPGDGQAMKTVNQLLCGIHIAAAAEALTLAKGLGLDPEAALQALGAGAASSFMLTNRGPRIAEALSGRAPDVLSRVDIFVKDMGIVADAGRDAGVALPVASAAEQLYRLGESAGLGACDDSTISTILSLEHHPTSTAPPS